MCNLPVPGTVEGRDFSRIIAENEEVVDEAAFFASYSPICNWHKVGMEYRAIRTARYTYVRSLQGAWLLFDNETDPFQIDNLVANPSFSEVKDRLDVLLQIGLREMNDEFHPHARYLERFNYRVGNDGVVPYKS